MYRLDLDKPYFKEEIKRFENNKLKESLNGEPRDVLAIKFGFGRALPCPAPSCMGRTSF